MVKQDINILLSVNDESLVDLLINSIDTKDTNIAYALEVIFTNIWEKFPYDRMSVTYDIIIVYEASLTDTDNKVSNLDIHLASKIKKYSPFSEIIVVTAHDRPIDEVFTNLQSGALHYGKIINLEHLNILISKAVEIKKLKQVLPKKQAVERLLTHNTTLFNNQKDDPRIHLKNILKTTCQLVVELLSADHSGFVLFDSDHHVGKVYAEYPETGHLDKEIPLQGIPIEERLINDKKTIPIENIEEAEDLGEIKQILMSWNIESILLVPVISMGKVLGSFSLDITKKRSFLKEEIELCNILATQVAVAIENAQVFEEIKNEQDLLRNLVEASQHIKAPTEIPILQQTIVRLATEIVNYKVGGLCENLPHLKELHLTEYLGFSENPTTDFPCKEGLIWEVAEKNKTIATCEYGKWHIQEDILKKYRFNSVIGVPIVHAGEVEAVLFVADCKNKEDSIKIDCEILERYAKQVSIALRTSKLLAKEQRIFGQLATLHKFGDFIQECNDLDKVLHLTLTAITANYGLGFNRAIFFFLEESNKRLIGQKGVGQLSDVDAREAWKGDSSQGLHDISRYFERLQRNDIFPTPVDKIAKTLAIPVSSDINTCIFSKVLAEKKCNYGKKIDELPSIFNESLTPKSSFAVAPLIARSEVLGLIYVDNQFTNSPITEELANLLMMFVDTAAIAIKNIQTFTETKAAREKLRLLLKASNEFIGAREPKRVLEYSVDKTREISDALWVRVVLINELGLPNKKSLILSGKPKQDIDIETIIREDESGITMKVVDTGITIVIEDINNPPEGISPNPSLKDEGSLAAICLPLSLPLSLNKKPIGVMWLHYDQPRRFSQATIDDLQLYVNQVALVYDSEKRIADLERRRKAADLLSKANNTKEVLAQIVESAQDVLQADWTAFWFYDEEQSKFISTNSLASKSISKDQWNNFLSNLPHQEGTANKVLKEKLITVEDINEVNKYSFLEERNRTLLQNVGVCSFQGVALSIADEKLGVLYANYNYTHKFSEEENNSAKSFADNAALALKKAKLLEEINRVISTADVVAKLSVLGEIKETLSSVVKETKTTLKCDAVTLYTYDSATEQISYPPIMEGVLYPEGTFKETKLPENSWVIKMMNKDEPYIAEKASEDPLFIKRRFTQEEGIETCVAIPLKVGSEIKVGVMFVNYRKLHPITSEELKYIKLFANQATVAIHNAQLFEGRRKRLHQQDALLNLSKELLSTLDPQQVLDKAVEVAKEVFNVDSCSIILDKKDELIFNATTDLENIIPNKTKLEGGRESQTGYTLKIKEDVIVDHFVKENRFAIHPFVEKYGFKSSMSVPMYTSGEINKPIGVMIIHTKYQRYFTKDEAIVFKLLANQTAIAYQSALRYGQLEKKSAHLKALYEASKAITSNVGLNRNAILDSILEQAINCLTSYIKPPKQDLKIVLGSIQTYDEVARELRFVSIYPHDDLFKIIKEIPKIIVKKPKKEREIGVTGLAVLEKRYKLVPDVSKEPQYIEFNSKTKSVLAVLLKDTQTTPNKVIGVLNVEGNLVASFDDSDVRTLQALAELAVIAIKNVFAYEELKLADKKKTEFLSNAAHELRTPATGLRLSIENLRKGRYDSLTNKQQETVERLYYNIERLNRLTENILNTSKIEGNRFKLDLEHSSISKIISDIIESFKYLAKEKNIKLTVDFPLNDPLEISIDPGKIEQVITNLVDNAIKFTKKNGDISLFALRDKNFIKVGVKDNGIGIPEEAKPNIFRRFFQVDQIGGTGIGLSLAKEIIELHKGEIWFKSELGKGTTFSFKLPNNLETIVKKS